MEQLFVTYLLDLSFLISCCCSGSPRRSFSFVIATGKYMRTSLELTSLSSLPCFYNGTSFDADKLLSLETTLNSNYSGDFVLQIETGPFHYSVSIKHAEGCFEHGIVNISL